MLCNREYRRDFLPCRFFSLIPANPTRPKVIGLFLAYFVAILLCLLGLKTELELARMLMWLYDQGTALQRWKFARGWDAAIIKWMNRLKARPICVWVKGDDIHNLLEAILYVRKNEITSRIIFLHAYEHIEDTPAELEANVKILDEAFPSITLDLIFLKGIFTPSVSTDRFRTVYLEIAYIIAS